MHAVVGPYRSAVSMPLALYLAITGVPSISYGSSATTLSDTALYPYFARTYPADTVAPQLLLTGG